MIGTGQWGGGGGVSVILKPFLKEEPPQLTNPEPRAVLQFNRYFHRPTEDTVLENPQIACFAYTSH